MVTCSVPLSHKPRCSPPWDNEKNPGSAARQRRATSSNARSLSSRCTFDCGGGNGRLRLTLRHRRASYDQRETFLHENCYPSVSQYITYNTALTTRTDTFPPTPRKWSAFCLPPANGHQVTRRTDRPVRRKILLVAYSCSSEQFDERAVAQSLASSPVEFAWHRTGSWTRAVSHSRAFASEPNATRTPRKFEDPVSVPLACHRRVRRSVIHRRTREQSP